MFCTLEAPRTKAARFVVFVHLGAFVRQSWSREVGRVAITGLELAAQVFHRIAQIRHNMALPTYQ